MVCLGEKNNQYELTKSIGVLNLSLTTCFIEKSSFMIWITFGVLSSVAKYDNKDNGINQKASISQGNIQ